MTGVQTCALPICFPVTIRAIIKHNKPEAVILSIEEYERMKSFQEYLENLEIAQVINERVLDKKEPIKMVSYEEMMERLKQKGLNV